MARLDWRALARTALFSDPNRRLLALGLAAATMLLPVDLVTPPEGSSSPAVATAPGRAPRPAEGVEESPAPARRQRSRRRRARAEVDPAPPPAPAAPAPRATPTPPPAAVPTLVLEHADLIARMAKGGVSTPKVEVRDGRPDRLSVAGYVTPLSIPVRADARFVRERGRVHLEVQEFSVRGTPRPDYQAVAAAKLARLVDVESAARRVEVRREGRVVYAQEVGP